MRAKAGALQARPTLAAHADWSVDPRKRWMSLARNSSGRWQLGPPRPVGAADTLFARLLAEAGGEPVALGADLPIGVPRAYAALRPESNFRAFLANTRAWPDFWRVCATLDEVRIDRPFYPARGIKGMTRAAHAAALQLGGPGGLSRACDRATAERPAGAPLFWTLGANQTGKAAIVAWRDMLLPALDTIRIWPFDGAFNDLLAPGTVAIAETYPAEAMRHLSIPTKGSKRRQSDRAAVAAPLLDAMDRLGVDPDRSMLAALRDGFGADAAGEDRFDCVLGLLCAIGVLNGDRPDTAPPDPWLTTWEGWVLGQTALPL